MAMQYEQLKRIADDLGGYIDQFCPSVETKPSDPSGEKCNEAYLMLLQAISDLDAS